MTREEIAFQIYLRFIHPSIPRENICQFQSLVWELADIWIASRNAQIGGLTTEQAKKDGAPF